MMDYAAALKRQASPIPERRTEKTQSPLPLTNLPSPESPAPSNSTQESNKNINNFKSKTRAFAPSPFKILLIDAQDRFAFNGRREKKELTNNSSRTRRDIFYKLAEYLSPQDLANLVLTSHSTKSLVRCSFQSFFLKHKTVSNLLLDEIC